ncbi:MAG: helix-turn-helix domain-containing protein [Thermoplasmata archaeon]
MKLFIININMAGLGLPAKYFYIHDKVLFVNRILKYDEHRIAYIAELKRNDFVEIDEVKRKKQEIMEKYNIEDFDIIDANEKLGIYTILIIQKMPDIFSKIYVLMDYSSFITTPMIIKKDKITLGLISKEEVANKISLLLDEFNIEYEIIRKINIEKDSKFTTRQMEIIIEAIKRGYYDTPRKINLIDLAKEFSVSTTVIERILRKAESVAIYELFKAYL